MSENNTEKANIKKKKSLKNIHFALSQATGELVSIESVESGLACGCICVACGQEMEARKGDMRRHHFAHVSNYKCLYGFEISVYKAFQIILENIKQIFLPDAVLRFNSYKPPEVIKPAYLQTITDVSYECEKGQYPPTLLCHVGKNKLQILLDFEGYYSRQDLNALKQTAKENNVALLLIHLDDVDKILTLDMLIKYVVDTSKGKEWIYNRVIDKFDAKYRSAAIQPTTFLGGVLCSAQKSRFRNIYSATWDDCVQCEYCYDASSENLLCLANKHINHIDDFDTPQEELKKKFEDLNHIAPIKRISDYKCPICGAPLRKVHGKQGVFAGCSNYPKCKKSYPVEPTTEQLIINNKLYHG